MRFSKKERIEDTLSLQGLGLFPEEIEGYFEFYDEIDVDRKKMKRVRVLNSGKNKNAGKNE
jgi:hypothetical protein